MTASHATSTAETSAGDPLIKLDSVTKEFTVDDSLLDRLMSTRSTLRAVNDVTLDIYPGETVGIVGESGCGKSTLAKLITGLHVPTKGTISIDGTPVGSVHSRSREQLAQVGVIFQNAKSSIDPRLTVRRAIEEPLRAAGWSRERRTERVEELYELVNLPEHFADRYAHELSGGQAQRVAIARALAVEPRILVLDEPVSALDLSVKGSIINLLLELQAELGLTYVVISHDLSVVKHIADRIAVMYLGELMEVGPAEQVFDRPSHPYTHALIESIPDGDPTTSIEDAFVLEGDVPSPMDPPNGCVFHTRCPHAEERCKAEEPGVHTVEAATTKCHFPEIMTDD